MVSVAFIEEGSVYFKYILLISLFLIAKKHGRSIPETKS